MTHQSINHSNGETFQTFVELADSELETRLVRSAERCRSWRFESYAKRAAIVGKASDLMKERRDQSARTITLKIGKRINEAKVEGKFSANADVFGTGRTATHHWRSPHGKQPDRVGLRRRTLEFPVLSARPYCSAIQSMGTSHAKAYACSGR